MYRHFHLGFILRRRLVFDMFSSVRVVNEDDLKVTSAYPDRSPCQSCCINVDVLFSLTVLVYVWVEDINRCAFL